jgi:hypothetical protein
LTDDILRESVLDHLSLSPLLFPAQRSSPQEPPTSTSRQQGAQMVERVVVRFYTKDAAHSLDISHESNDLRRAPWKALNDRSSANQVKDTLCKVHEGRTGAASNIDRPDLRAIC